MNKIRLWGVVWAVIVMAGSVCGEEIKLWPDGAPGAVGTEKNDTPTLRTFPLPWDVKGPVPAVLLIPGGGYKHISGYGTFRDFFRTRPVRFFSMRYRLPVHGYRHPAPLQDARRAVAMIRAHAQEWNVDPKRILVVAFSSGGHVATTLATHDQPADPDAEDRIERFSSHPNYMALFCPVVSMKDHAHGPSVARLLGPNPGATLIDDLSNELQVTAKTPPTFLAHAKDDGLVPPENSMLYHEALKRAGVATTLKLYNHGGHGVTKKPNPWKADLGDWMSEIGILPEGVARAVPGAAKLYEPTTDYTVKTLAGWQVYVHKALLGDGEYAKTGAVAMERLTDAMLRIKTWTVPMVEHRGISTIRDSTGWWTWTSILTSTSVWNSGVANPLPREARIQRPLCFCTNWPTPITTRYSVSIILMSRPPTGVRLRERPILKRTGSRATTRNFSQASQRGISARNKIAMLWASVIRSLKSFCWKSGANPRLIWTHPGKDNREQVVEC